jgi:hypothetical protein
LCKIFIFPPRWEDLSYSKCLECFLLKQNLLMTFCLAGTGNEDLRQLRENFDLSNFISAQTVSKIIKSTNKILNLMENWYCNKIFPYSAGNHCPKIGKCTVKKRSSYSKCSLHFVTKVHSVHSFIIYNKKCIFSLTVQ